MSDFKIQFGESENLQIGVGFSEYTDNKYPDYTGTYEVTPTTQEQVLQTAQKSLSQNVTVHKVPYSSVSNPQGGNTVTIL